MCVRGMSNGMCLVAVGLLALMSVSLTAPARAVDAVDEPRPLPEAAWIVDTDMGVDDWLALLFLLQAPRQTVLGIATSGNGLASCDYAPINALRLLALAGRDDEVPVACGPAHPPADATTFPLPWREATDEMLGLDLPPAGAKRDDRTSSELIRDLLRTAERPVNLLAMGPLSNLAAALEDEPVLVAKIDTLVVVGGAIEVPGNLIVPGFTETLTNEVAEWNLFLDPEAAAAVFGLGVPTLLVPLDATRQARVAYTWLQDFEASAATPVAGFTTEVLQQLLDPEDAGAFDLGDALAAVVGVDRRLCGYRMLPLEIVTGAPEVAGESRVSANGHWVTVCLTPDVPATLAFFAERLNRAE